MNTLVNNVAYALFAAGPLPMLGPGADMRRRHGFQRGKAWTATALKAYGAVNRAALLAECRARGLESSGTVTDLKARLGRSDDGLLEAADWQPLAAAGPASTLDTDGLEISGMDYGALKELLRDQQMLKGEDWMVAALPHTLGTAVGPADYAMRLIRQFAAYLVNEPSVRVDGEENVDEDSRGKKRERGPSAAEIDMELRVRSTKLRSRLLTDTSLSEQRRRLIVGGAFTPSALSAVEATLLPGIEAGTEFTTVEIQQAIRSALNVIDDTGPAPGPAPSGGGASDQEQRLNAILDAAEKRGSALSGETKDKMERLENRARATAATLASVALPPDQAEWRDKLMQLEKQLNEAEDIEAEITAAGGKPGKVLVEKLTMLRKRLKLYTVAARDGMYGLRVMSQLEDAEQFGSDAMEEYMKLEKSLKKRSDKTLRGDTGSGNNSNFGYNTGGAGFSVATSGFGGRGSGGFGGWNGARQQHGTFSGGAASGPNGSPVGGTHGGLQPPMGRGAAMVQPAWMQQGPPGVSVQQPNGNRLVGKSGHVVHLENNYLDSPVRSAAVGGASPNSQLCRYCAAQGHFAWECPELRSMFAAGKIDRQGHPA